jgi:hypothetical protein
MKTRIHPSKILGGLIAATACVTLAPAGFAQGDVNNGVSAFPITVDGLFTDAAEWSDVTPAAFISSPAGVAQPTSLTDPARNSLLFAALGHDATDPLADVSLFLLYDFLPRTQFDPITPGEILASVTFPITLPGNPTGNKTTISVLVQAANLPVSPGAVVGSFFDIFVDLDLDGDGDVSAASLGITGDADFGPSSLGAAVPHLLVELEVPLRIPQGFGTPGGPLPGNGINPATGLYDPDPAFWGAAGAPGERPQADGPVPPLEPLQSASSALFTINPSGSITVTPVPEPASAALLLAGLGFLAARRRRD